jgi:hypothetical protein
VQGSLERWRSVAFLLAGIAFFAIAINDAFRTVANTGMNLSPLVHLGLLLFVYAGVLGMSPQLVERAPRLGRVGQVLVLVFGLEIVLTFGVGILPESIPRSIFALTVAMAIIGAALTITVFGATSLWSQAYSRAVGGFLLLAAFGLYLLIAKVILFGDIGGPEWMAVVYNGLFAISMIAVGLLLRTDRGLTEQAESTETAA